MCEVLAAYPHQRLYTPRDPEKIGGDQLNELLSSSSSAASSPATSPTDRQFDIDCAHGLSAGAAAAAAAVTRTVLLIDSRNMFKFNESHVRESVNVSQCPLFEKRIRDGKLRIVEYLESRVSFGTNQDIVIYDDSDCSDFTRLIYDNLWTVLKATSHHIRLLVLAGGYDAFRSRYPQHCTNGVPFVHRFMGPTCADDESAFLNMEATQITPSIFIGGLHDASSEAVLQRLGITHIINCSRTPYKRADKYKYLPLECADDLKQSLEEKLKPAFDMIEEAEGGNGRVLVHCYAGISRSAAIVIAYLMQLHSWSYAKCYQHVKSKRTIIAPNINFVGQLMKFEGKLNIDDSSPAEDVVGPSAAAGAGKGEGSTAAGAAGKPTGLRLSSPVSCCLAPVSEELTSCTPPQPMETDPPPPPPQPQEPAEAAASPMKRGRPPCAGVAASKPSKFMQRKQLAGMPCVRLPPPRSGTFRYDDIASAPILPAGYNPFAEAFRNANSKSSGSPP